MTDQILSASLEPVSIKGRQIASVESVLRNKEIASDDTVDGGELIFVHNMVESLHLLPYFHRSKR